MHKGLYTYDAAEKRGIITFPDGNKWHHYTGDKVEVNLKDN